MRFSVRNIRPNAMWLLGTVASGCFFAVAQGNKLISYFRAPSQGIDGELEWKDKADDLADNHESKATIQNKINALIANNTLGIEAGVSQSSYSYVIDCCKMIVKGAWTPGTDGTGFWGTGSANVIQLHASINASIIDDFKDLINKICDEERHRASDMEAKDHEPFAIALVVILGVVAAGGMAYCVGYCVRKSAAKIKECRTKDVEAEERQSGRLLGGGGGEGAATVSTPTHSYGGLL